MSSLKYGVFISNAGRNSGGPEVFESELIRSFARLDQENEYHLFCLNRAAKSVIGIEQDNIIYHDLRPDLRPVSMLFDLPYRIARIKPDVMHAPVIPPPIVPGGLIFTLVCSTLIKHPELYPPLIRLRLKALVQPAIQKARLLLTVSEDVRNHAIEAFKLPPEKVRTVYLGVNPSFRPLERSEIEATIAGKYGIHDPYFLFSGRWEKRKNIFRVLEAFTRFKSEHRTNYKLVFTGGRSWSSDEVEQFIDKLGIESDFIDAGKSPLTDLPPLYAGAAALVYPSLWEGFGMPIVEAMACGTPIITSNLSSMPEIAGNAALLVDPYSSDEIQEAFYRISSDPRMCRTLAANGLKRSKKFTWDSTARQTLAAYRQLIAEGDTDSSSRIFIRRTT